MPSRTTARHYAKRKGQHQKRNKHFLSVYVPYLPMIAFLISGLLISFHWKPQTGQQVLSYATETSGDALLSLTNQERSNNGAGALAINAKLSAAAQAKANDMAARNYWSHNTPDGNTPWTFIANAGYSYSRAGENLAYGFATSKDTITGWMNSPSHRENLLNTNYTEVGFGYTNAANYNNSGEETIVVAMYATPLASAAPAAKPAETAPPKAAAKQTTVAATPQQPAVAHEVQVTVLDSNKKPAVGIKVVLHSDPKEATTDNDGVALFKDVEPGEHTAIAEVDGAKSEQPVTVAADSKVVSATMAKPELSPNKTDTVGALAAIPAPKKVSRLDVITKGALPWAASVMSVVALLGSGYVLGKHSRALHRLVVRGERYVLQHSVLDATIISFVWLCFVVSRSAGVIL